ncbi:MAG: 16S rRNA (cytosine(1402)-N(4))-methyltransferase RsmH [Bacteroidales bacterium]|nr:16S rRNA (cytosine(1402)-N(4))-methyltransferase RsmH [Bacteroidales bacterium]
MYHIPVFLESCIAGLNIQPNGLYVDVTFGGGGHSTAILQHLNEEGKLFAFDQDADALQNAIDDSRFTLIHQNFRYLKNFLKYYKIEKANGILADLGVSSYQFDQPEKGFSTRFESSLDMRMDQRNDKTAADIVNDYEWESLTRILRTYGELDNAAKIADIIVQQRPFSTTTAFLSALSPIAPRHREAKFAAQIFQALRIEVNDEINALKDLLTQSAEMLAVNGRLVVMSYHSLEDRLVKNFMKSGNFEGNIEKDFFGNPLVPFHCITRKPIVADEIEMEKNSRSRSVKLRIAEKI